MPPSDAKTEKKIIHSYFIQGNNEMQFQDYIIKCQSMIDLIRMQRPVLF